MEPLPFSPCPSDSDSGEGGPEPDEPLDTVRARVSSMTPHATVEGLYISEQEVLTRARELAERGNRILEVHPPTIDPTGQRHFCITYLDTAQTGIRQEAWPEDRRTAWVRVRPSNQGRWYFAPRGI